jgi:hypothetical protein
MSSHSNSVIGRYDSTEERDKVFLSWVSKNGIPKKDFSCICCGHIFCPKGCTGITSKLAISIFDDPEIKEILNNFRFNRS